MTAAPGVSAADSRPDHKFIKLIRRLSPAGAALALVMSLASPDLAQASESCALDRVDLRGPAGVQSFTIELADTADARAKGLMFRQQMAPDAGMLFVYPGVGRAQFWMKNTLIPLDMLFLDPQGRVLKIHPQATPQSEQLIDGGEGVQYVLEINGGLAADLGIKPGAELRHPRLGKTAAWPCD